MKPHTAQLPVARFRRAGGVSPLISHALAQSHEYQGANAPRSPNQAAIGAGLPTPPSRRPQVSPGLGELQSDPRLGRETGQEGCRAADGTRRVPATLAALVLALAVCPAAMAQDAGPDEAEKPARAVKDLTTESLPLRTALHHDPTLAAPLARLLEMYRGAGAEQELLGLYQAHVAQYPGNLSGQTVLVRLLMATGSPEALSRARAAAAQFPRDGYLRYLVHQILQGRRDPKALEELDKAIALQTDPARKTAWVDQLLPLAIGEGRRDLAEKHLVALAELAAAPQARLEVARKMIKHRFFERALALLEKPEATAPSPETMVSLELEAATAEVGLDRGEAAAARLDKLLARLTADYWRRSEIVARRLALVKSQAERDAMVAAARRRVAERPRDEAAVLDLAEMLSGFQLRRDALDALLAAGRELPKSAEIERRTLDLFDRLRDEHGRQKYLAERIAAQPDRDDLVLMQVKTLYLLGRSGEARAGMAKLVKDAAPAERAAALLAVARFLRRCALPADAAELLRQVAEADLLALDVRRELAETYLVLGRRQEVRALLARPIPKEAELEKLMDLVQFMIQQEFFVEARAALADRIDQEKTNLEIRMLLLTVHRRLGNQVAGRQLIEQSRGLADTVARYRLWLESAVTFHESFETSEAFLAGEQTGLDQDSGPGPEKGDESNLPRSGPEGASHKLDSSPFSGPWGGKHLERRMIFAEIAARGGRRAEIVAMLRAGLEGELSPEARVRVRRQLIALLEKDKLAPAVARRSSAAIRKQLEALAKDAPQYADECHARLALLHIAVERLDLAMPLVQKIDPDKIQDAALLAGLKNFHREHTSDHKKLLAILRRLTVLNPTERSTWVEWIGSLAAAGDETQLCQVLRRLLAGVDKMPLSDDTHRLLEQHLADSHWRSIARLIADGQDSALADALPVVDAVERIARDDQQWLWIAWTRAYLLGRLGRTKARDEAIKELGRVARKLHDPMGSPEARIAFPDGLSVSLEHARKLLTAPPPPPPAGPAPRRGPLGPLAAKWVFDTGSAGVAAIVPLADKRVLICDRAGNGYCLDAGSGRLLWQREGLAPPMMPQPQQNQYGYSSGYVMSYGRGESAVPSLPEMLADGKGRLYVPGTSEVTCHATDDGRLLWRADVGDVGRSKPGAGQPGAVIAGQPGMVSPSVALFLYRDQLLTYEPVSGTATRIDPATGKIVWDRTFPGQGQASLGAHNSGASLWGDRLMIYGSKTAIIDVSTGQVEWSFEPYRVRKLPVELRHPDAKPSAPSASVPIASYGGHANPYAGPSYPPGMVVPRYGRTRLYGGHGPYAQPVFPVQYVDYLRQQHHGGALPPGGMRLTSSAVTWAAQAEDGSPREAMLVDRWLLLFGPSGLQVVRTDLPLTSRPVGQQGVFLGLSGRTACLLTEDRLTTVNLTTGATRQHDLASPAWGQVEAMEQMLATGARGPYLVPSMPMSVDLDLEVALQRARAVPLQIAVDGPLLYVTRGPGVLGISAGTGQRAFEAPWPKEVAPPKVQQPKPEDTAATTGYVPGRVSRYHGPVGYAPSITWSPYMVQGEQPGAVAAPPTIARVDRGVLYTLVSPTKVVALAQRGADGR